MGFDLSILASPLGLFGLLGAVLGILLVVFRRAAMFLGLGIVFLGGAIGIVAEGETKYGSLTYGMFYPIQANRHVLYIGGGLLCWLAALVHGSRCRWRPPSAPALWLLLLGLYTGTLLFLHAEALTAVASLGTVLVVLGGVVLLTSTAMHDRDTTFAALRMFCFAAIVWIAGTLAQIAVNPAAVTLGNRSRFCGLAPNPQQTAAFLAVVSVVALFLLFNDTRLRYRPLWIGLLVFALPLLAWTGSRTGALMFVIGGLPILYRRFGRVILILPVVAIGLLLVVNLLQQQALTDSLERLTSTENTRAGAWQALIDTATSSPWVGVGVYQLVVSENSVLYAFAAFGVGALAIVLCMMLASAIQAIRLLPLLRSPDLWQRRTAELCLGFLAMFYLATMFEGLLVARISVMLPIFVVFSTLAQRVRGFGAEGDGAAPTNEPTIAESEFNPIEAARYAGEESAGA